LVDRRPGARADGPLRRLRRTAAFASGRAADPVRGLRPLAAAVALGRGPRGAGRLLEARARGCADPPGAGDGPFAAAGADAPRRDRTGAVRGGAVGGSPG